MFALKVGCLGYCPRSFLLCFEALGLPKSATRQFRSEASKTTLRSSHVLFLRRGRPTWECQAVPCWTLLTSFRICCFFSSFALPFRFAPFAPRDNSFRFQVYTNNSRFSIPQLSDVHRTQRVLKFFARFLQEYFTEQPVSCALSLRRYVDSTMRVRVVDWWISLSNLQLAALTF